MRLLPCLCGIVVFSFGIHVAVRCVLRRGVVMPRQSSGGDSVDCVIHQTWKTKNLDAAPSGWKQSSEAWRRMHPECTYLLWSDKDLRNLIKNKFSWFLGTYDGYPNAIQRVDAARYFILQSTAVCIDLDIVPIRNVLPKLQKGVTLSITPNVGLTNAFMAAPRNHPFFRHVVHRLSNETRWKWLGRHFEIVGSTGPLFLWECFWSFSDVSEITLITPSEWGKCSLCERCEQREESLFVHLKGDSWHQWDSKVWSYVLQCYPVPILALVGSIIMIAVGIQNKAPVQVGRLAKTTLVVLSLLSIGSAESAPRSPIVYQTWDTEVLPPIMQLWRGAWHRNQLEPIVVNANGRTQDVVRLTQYERNLAYLSAYKVLLKMDNPLYEVNFWKFAGRSVWGLVCRHGCCPRFWL